MNVLRCVGIGVILVALALGARAQEPLWSIGAADNDTRDLALAPDGHGRYDADPVFVVGHSDPARDWPYVHPGPSDDWAGTRPHTFTVLFGLKKAPSSGVCTLHLDFVDTHSGGPPKLLITLNGVEHRLTLPRGGGDASISGDLAKGKEHVVDLEFPADALVRGNNELRITTASGSWVLYDAVSFVAPRRAQLGPLANETVITRTTSAPVLLEQDGRLMQTVRMDLRHVGPETEAQLAAGDGPTVTVSLTPGVQQVEVSVPAVDAPRKVPVRIAVGGKTVAEQVVRLDPVRKWVVYLLHHTHLDIGYTHVQSDVEKKQWEFLDQAVELALATAENPPGSRFKWSPEGLWAVDSYLNQASPEQHKAFFAAIEDGSIGLDALYGNELTALCRPEELLELTGCARRMATEHNLVIDSAMITDVPGYTWGIVPTLAQSGVKYLSIGPNAGHRIGFTLSAWGDRPFYWVSPSGQEKVLCWVAAKAYSWYHRGPIKDGNKILGYLQDLDRDAYPYDIVQVRYNIGGDNGPPDTNLPAFVRAWNEKYAYPKLLIATTSEMFRDFEAQYADIVPSVTGDFTPYWEDGAASSARETALARAAAERLVQANAVWACQGDADNYDAAAFQAAWREVLLYNEHTWGAHNSISEPEGDFAKQQWAIKQAFALEAERQSQALLERALDADAAAASSRVEILNTTSWSRTDVVEWPDAENRWNSVTRDGEPVACQRLSSGALAFLAKDVPPFASVVFDLHKAMSGSERSLDAAACSADGRLTNGLVTVEIDAETGAVSKVTHADLRHNLVDDAAGPGLNDYLYVEGRSPDSPKRNGPVTVRVVEEGPLVASIVTECAAPGCRSVTREVRVYAGLDRIDLITTLDKENVYRQEAVHLAFPFDVPNGVVRMDTPWAVVRPEADQLPGSCKNYFTVQRWVDVSNQDFGVTWATVDAPLIELGRITCDPRAVGWIERLEPTQTIYSYVMNNYWETNYKASQDGPTTFRYALQPHARFDAAAATRFGTERSQPLIVRAATDEKGSAPALRIAPKGVVATMLKPSDDGKAWIVRLFGASGRPESVTITDAGGEPAKAWMSDLFETKGERVDGSINLPAYGIATVRVAAR
ncbi:MAG: hypothetical protein GY851_03715 [bacterium]|nr:hypothetical protein [bacterium]